MSYMKRKARKIRNELLAEAGCPLATSGNRGVPWPLLKAKLDKAFSELVRMSHADDQGKVKCITCPATGFWRDFDNGHFVDRDQLPTRWDGNNCWPQCQVCNRFKTGRRYQFGRALDRKYGEGAADILIARGEGKSDQIRQQAPQMLEDIRAKLKIERKRLKGVTRG